MKLTVSTERLVCPICNSEDDVDGFKVCIGQQWWHRCCKKNHDSLFTLNGVEHQWPEYPYFCGNVVETAIGNIEISYMLNTERDIL